MLRNLAMALLLAILLPGGAAASQDQDTLLEVARTLQAGAQALAECAAQGVPQPTWGQALARQDLQGLASAAGELAGAMESGDPTVTPQSLQPATSRLDVARSRVKASLPLLGLPDAEAAGAALLDQAARLSASLRQLDNRYLGQAQVRGSGLGQVSVGQAAQPLVYPNPDALFREARGIRSSAEQMLASRICGRGLPGRLPLGVSVSTLEDRYLRDLVRAACDFETQVADRSQDAQATRPAFLRLRQAWLRATPYWGDSFGNFAAGDLERAMRRLEAFYRQLEP